MSNKNAVVYTLFNECQDCYKCVRRCPGGCIAGNACLGSLKDAFKKVKAYGEKGQSLEERKKYE